MSNAEAWLLRADLKAQNGDLRGALTYLNRAVAARPCLAAALHARGVVLAGLDRTADALADFDAALSLEPNLPNGWCNRGVMLSRLGQLEEALGSYDQALQSCPDHRMALLRRGLVLLDLHRPAEALDSLSRLLTAQPDHADGLVARAVALGSLNRDGESIDSLRRALAAEPRHLKALTALAIKLLGRGEMDEALAQFDRALLVAPQSGTLHANRAVALQNLGRYPEAAEAYRLALEVLSDSPELWFCYGRFLLDHAKRPDEACVAFARMAELQPHPDNMWRALDAQMQACDWTDLDARIGVVTEAVEAGRCVAPPFFFLSISQSAASHIRCALTTLERQYPNSRQAPWRPGRHERGPEDAKRIRLAYVSADFRNHPTTHLLTELIELHDRTRFEVIGVSIAKDDGSAAGLRIRAAFDRHVDVAGLSNANASDQLRSVGADIAVDLMGHTRLARFALFMQRAAPLQIQYLGYPALGAVCMDYIIADRMVVPPEQESLLSDNIICLPDTMQVNNRHRPISDNTPSRAEVGLPERSFVFCCFNNSNKLTPTLFDIWMRLLRTVNDSVLWLLDDNLAVSRNLRAEAAARDVSPDRLVFAPRTQLADHLARHRLADLFLDTLPVNACTTASDALWAGVPVVTCLGDSFTARVAASLLQAMGLPELITTSLSDYEALCLHLARSPEAMATLHRRVAEKRETAPLFDSNRFCRHIEAAYAIMWERQERGQPPAGFSVPSIS